MKRRLLLVLVALLLWGLAACRQDPGPAAFVLVTDPRQEQQGLSLVLQSAAEAQGMAATVVVATENTEQARISAIDAAVSGGAEGILCVGEAFAPVIYEAQKLYPQVMFLLLDGEPKEKETQVYETAVNTHCILFREEQAGFLAGYAAVWEGYRSLGYCAGMETSRSMRYGYGFVQGADTAAARLGLKQGEVSIRYWYVGKEASEELTKKKMADWYSQGVELILGCDDDGTEVTKSLVSVAETSGGKVMVTDGNWSMISPVVLASVEKNYPRAVWDALLTMTDGIWSSAQAGQTETLGAAESGIVLLGNEGHWRLEHFSQEDSQSLLREMARGDLTVDPGTNRDSLPATAFCTLKEHSEDGA
ncbi:MAG: family transporter substrate-binding protein [Firmicutes bacterium]|nr:family transporter substrate-binding protein [Bacillota bacterium]